MSARSDIAAAAAALGRGELAVIPTDTVYGIAADAGNQAAIDALFTAKGRPEDKPIPLLAHDAEALRGYVELDERALKLARRFWPGGLTLVLPRHPAYRMRLSAGFDDSIAVRVPSDDLALELLGRTGPLATTSANRSGDAPVETVAHAQTLFGSAVVAYIDGGPRRGAPSTVVSLVGEARVLRAGVVDPELVLGTV